MSIPALIKPLHQGTSTAPGLIKKVNVFAAIVATLTAHNFSYAYRPTEDRDCSDPNTDRNVYPKQLLSKVTSVIYNARSCISINLS